MVGIELLGLELLGFEELGNELLGATVVIQAVSEELPVLGLYFPLPQGVHEDFPI